MIILEIGVSTFFVIWILGMICLGISFMIKGCKGYRKNWKQVETARKTAKRMERLKAAREADKKIKIPESVKHAINEVMFKRAKS